MASRISQEKKSKPGTMFVFKIPLSFSISAPYKLKKEFDDSFKSSSGNPNKYLKKKFLEIFEVNKIEDLLKKTPRIRKKVRELRDEFKDEAGFDRNEFSEWARIKMKEKINEKD